MDPYSLLSRPGILFLTDKCVSFLPQTAYCFLMQNMIGLHGIFTFSEQEERMSFLLPTDHDNLLALESHIHTPSVAFGGSM